MSLTGLMIYLRISARFVTSFNLHRRKPALIFIFFRIIKFDTLPGPVNSGGLGEGNNKNWNKTRQVTMFEVCAYLPQKSLFNYNTPVLLRQR
jgi:hypothetical protein